MQVLQERGGDRTPTNRARVAASRPTRLGSAHPPVSNDRYAVTGGEPTYGVIDDRVECIGAVFDGIIGTGEVGSVMKVEEAWPSLVGLAAASTAIRSAA